MDSVPLKEGIRRMSFNMRQGSTRSPSSDPGSPRETAIAAALANVRRAADAARRSPRRGEDGEEREEGAQMERSQPIFSPRGTSGGSMLMDAASPGVAEAASWVNRRDSLEGGLAALEKALGDLRAAASAANRRAAESEMARTAESKAEEAVRSAAEGQEEDAAALKAVLGLEEAFVREGAVLADIALSDRMAAKANAAELRRERGALLRYCSILEKEKKRLEQDTMEQREELQSVEEKLRGVVGAKEELQERHGRAIQRAFDAERGLEACRGELDGVRRELESVERSRAALERSRAMSGKVWDGERRKLEEEVGKVRNELEMVRKQLEISEGKRRDAEMERTRMEERCEEVKRVYGTKAEDATERFLAMQEEAKGARKALQEALDATRPRTEMYLELEQRAGKAEGRNAALESRVEDLESRLEQSKQERQSLETQIASLQSQLQTAQQSSSQALQAEQATSHRLQTALDTANLRLETLQSSHRSHRQKLVHIARTLQSRIQSVRTTQTAIQQVGEQSRELANWAKEKSQELEKKRGKLHSAAKEDEKETERRREELRRRRKEIEDRMKQAEQERAKEMGGIRQRRRTMASVAKSVLFTRRLSRSSTHAGIDRATSLGDVLRAVHASEIAEDDSEDTGEEDEV